MTEASHLGTDAALIVISVSVLLSYWFSHIGRRFRLPSVVFLLAAGLSFRKITDAWGSTVLPPAGVLPVLGTIGLILIVLEGGLDLNLEPGRGRRVFLLRTLGAAVAGTVGTALVFAFGFAALFGTGAVQSLLMALPFAVVSSAVAIPSSEQLPADDREFVIYETSWSDIVGVMLFNATLLASTSGGGGATLNLVGGGAAVLVLGALLGLAVFWFVGHLEGHVKFVPLIFALVGVYGATTALQLSPLLIVLILGLMLNNPHLILRWPLLQGLASDHYEAELERLKHLTAEATFFVRTLFFLLLGYSTDLVALADWRAIAVAAVIVAAIFALRVPVLRAFAPGRVRPLVWLGPRGLVTVLLFYSLPEGTVPAEFPRAALILVVLLSCVVMAVGLRRDQGRTPP